MGNIKRSTLANFSTGYANIVFTFINSFVLVPLYFRYFDLHTYGSWLASGNIISMVALIESGLSIVAVQALANVWSSGNKPQFARTAGSIITISLIISVVYVLSILVLSPYIPSWVKCKQADYSSLVWAIRFSALSTAVSFMFVPSHSFLASMHKMEGFAIVNVIGSVVGLVTNFVCLLYFDLGIISIALSYLVKSIFIFLAGSFIMLRLWRRLGLLRPSFSWISVKGISISMGSVFVGRLFGAITDNSQEFLVTTLINPSVAAVVSITSRLFALIRMAISPVYHAMFPVLASFYSSDDTRFMRSVTSMRVLFIPVSIILCSVAIIVNEPFIIIWLGPEKFGGIVLSLILAFNTFLYIKYNSDLFILNSMGQFRWLSLYTMIDAIIRISCICLIYFSAQKAFIWTVPVIELAGMLTICVLAHIKTIKSLKHFAQLHVSDFEFLLQAILFFGLSIGVYEMMTLRPGSWIQLGLYSFIVFLVFSLLNFSHPKTRKAFLGVLRKVLPGRA